MSRWVARKFGVCWEIWADRGVQQSWIRWRLKVTRYQDQSIIRCLDHWTKPSPWDERIGKTASRLCSGSPLQPREGFAITVSSQPNRTLRKSALKIISTELWPFVENLSTEFLFDFVCPFSTEMRLQLLLLFPTPNKIFGSLLKMQLININLVNWSSPRCLPLLAVIENISSSL